MRVPFFINDGQHAFSLCFRFFFCTGVRSWFFFFTFYRFFFISIFVNLSVSGICINIKEIEKRYKRQAWWREKNKHKHTHESVNIQTNKRSDFERYTSCGKWKMGKKLNDELNALIQHNTNPNYFVYIR